MRSDSSDSERQLSGPTERVTADVSACFVLFCKYLNYESVGPISCRSGGGIPPQLQKYLQTSCPHSPNSTEGCLCL